MGEPSIYHSQEDQSDLSWRTHTHSRLVVPYLLSRPPLACSHIVVAVIAPTVSTGLRLPPLHTSSHCDTTHALLFHFVQRLPPLQLIDSIVALAIVHVCVEFPYLCSCMSNSTVPKHISSNCARVKEVCTVPLRTVWTNHMSQINWTLEVKHVGHATDCPV